MCEKDCSKQAAVLARSLTEWSIPPLLIRDRIWKKPSDDWRAGDSTAAGWRENLKIQDFQRLQYRWKLIGEIF